MAVGLSCELPWRFRAIAASGGSNLTSLCPDAGATDALILHGSADPIAPVSGNTIPFTPPVGLSVDEVVASFATRNSCEPTPTATPITPSVIDDHYSCDGHRLDYWRIEGAGHTWAGAQIALDAITGPTDRSFSATAAVLEYFDAS
jgi:poly(3-hydroxybutyrate) depolymerase